MRIIPSRKRGNNRGNGDFLKKYGLTITIFGREFSISLFLIGVILIKIFLF